MMPISNKKRRDKYKLDKEFREREKARALKYFHSNNTDEKKESKRKYANKRYFLIVDRRLNKRKKDREYHRRNRKTRNAKSLEWYHKYKILKLNLDNS